MLLQNDRLFFFFYPASHLHVPGLWLEENHFLGLSMSQSEQLHGRSDGGFALGFVWGIV